MNIELLKLIKTSMSRVTSLRINIFFFLRMNLCNFIKVNELHLNVKMKQHVLGHLPSILENLICVKHVSLDYELHYFRFS